MLKITYRYLLITHTLLLDQQNYQIMLEVFYFVMDSTN
jgi:hypothetical protein